MRTDGIKSQFRFYQQHINTNTGSQNKLSVADKRACLECTMF